MRVFFIFLFFASVQVHAIVGGIDTSSPDEFAVIDRYPVIRAITDRPTNLAAHESFDLALVQFSGDLPAGYAPTSYVNSFTTPTVPFFLDVAGYGETSAKAGDSGELRFGLALIYHYNPAQPEFKADQTNGMGICQGDSGGPAYLRIGNEYYVIGVTHATIGDTPKGQKGPDSCKGISFFVSTIYFQNWIAEKLNLFN